MLGRDWIMQLRFDWKSRVVAGIVRCEYYETLSLTRNILILYTCSDLVKRSQKFH